MNHRRQIPFFLFVVALLSLLAGQALAVPLLLGHQARLLTGAGGPVADGKYSLVISIYTAENAVDSLWSEALVGLPVKDGVLALTLGANAKNPLTIDLFAKNSDLWEGVAVDGDPELPRQRLASVPYAVAASEAAHAALAEGLTKPIGADSLQAFAISADKVNFTYAGSAAKGGSANLAIDLQCTACVDTAELVNLSVTTGKIADAAVTTEKLADGAVTLNKVGFNFAGSDKKGGAAAFAESASSLDCTGCVATAMVAANAITTAKVADNAITAGKIADGAVTTGKIGANAVVTASIADAAITATKIGSLMFPVQDKPVQACDVAHFGWTYASKADNAVYVCNGDSYFPIVIAAIGTQKSPAVSCLDIIKKAPASKTGAYWLDPDGAGGIGAFQAYCEMDTDGGGWTLVGKTEGQAYNSDNGQLDGHDTTRWKNKAYIGDITSLAPAAALGASYESVAFTDFMFVGLNNGAKKLGWRMAQSFPSLYTVFNAGVPQYAKSVLFGNHTTLDWRPGCGTGAGPDGTGPEFYGFVIRSDGATTSPGLFNGYTQGWCSALAGWGRNNTAGNYTGGGLGADCQGHDHQMGRHYWGYGDGCDAAGWSNQSNFNSFFGHAFFVR